MSSYKCVDINGLARTISDRDDNLADLGIAQHVRVCVGDPLQGERLVEHRFECARGESVQQIGGKTLTTDQRLLRGACAKGDTDDARAFACYLVEIAVANPTGVAADAYQPSLDCEHADVIGEHRPADLVDYHVDATL